MKHNRLAPWLVAAWALASTVLGRCFTALAHGTNDASLFAYMATRCLHGAVLYVDVWDNKPPGIFAVNAAVFSVFPKSFGALAVVEGLVVLGGSLSVYLLLRLARAPALVAYFGVAAFAVTANLHTLNEGGNLTEIYLLLFPALSFYCFWRSLPEFRARWLVAAGFLSGVATLFKQVGFASVLAEVSFLFLQWVVWRRLPLRRWTFGAGLLAAGAAASWLPVVAYFAVHHALRPLWDACFASIVVYSESAQTAGLAVLRKPFATLQTLQPLSALVICAIIGLAAYHRESAAPSIRGTIGNNPSELRHYLWPSAILWLAYDFLGALAGRDYNHYYLAVIPSLTVTASFSLWWVIDVLDETKAGRQLAALFAALVLCPLVFSQAGDVLDAARLARHPAARGDVQLVGGYLASVRKSNNTLFMWDYLPEIYLETGMRSPVPELSAFRIYQVADRRLRHQEGQRILAEMTKALPTYLVDADFSRMKIPTGDPDYGQFQLILQSDYDLVYRANSIRVYRRRSGPAAKSRPR